MPLRERLIASEFGAPRQSWPTLSTSRLSNFFERNGACAEPLLKEWAVSFDELDMHGGKLVVYLEQVLPWDIPRGKPESRLIGERRGRQHLTYERHTLEMVLGA